MVSERKRTCLARVICTVSDSGYPTPGVFDSSLAIPIGDSQRSHSVDHAECWNNELGSSADLLSGKAHFTTYHVCR